MISMIIFYKLLVFQTTVLNTPVFWTLTVKSLSDQSADIAYSLSKESESIRFGDWHCEVTAPRRNSDVEGRSIVCGLSRQIEFGVAASCITSTPDVQETALYLREKTEKQVLYLECKSN